MPESIPAVKPFTKLTRKKNKSHVVWQICTSNPTFKDALLKASQGLEIATEASANLTPDVPAWQFKIEGDFRHPGHNKMVAVIRVFHRAHIANRELSPRNMRP